MCPNSNRIRTMRRSVEHEAQGIFIAEGEKVTRRLLESHFTVVSVVLPKNGSRIFVRCLKRARKNLPFISQKNRCSKVLVGYSLFQGVLSVGKIPLPASLDDILIKTSKPKLLTAIDGLSNAENLGAVVRNCVAFGAHRRCW